MLIAEATNNNGKVKAGLKACEEVHVEAGLPFNLHKNIVKSFPEALKIS